MPQPPDEEELPGPLSESTIDSVSRTSMGSDQVGVILDVNKALKAKQLDRESAIATLAASLGITPEEAEKFIPKEVAPQPIPPGLAGGPPIPGGDDEDEDEDDES